MVPKPGYKTTEFLLTVLLAVGALAASIGDQLAPRYAAIAAAVSVAAYTIARGITKFGALVNPQIVVTTAPVTTTTAPPTTQV